MGYGDGKCQGCNFKGNMKGSEEVIFEERVFSVKASGSGRELGRQGFRLWSPEALV